MMDLMAVPSDAAFVLDESDAGILRGGPSPAIREALGKIRALEARQERGDPDR